jgi:outer membrane beta-barrel protein
MNQARMGLLVAAALLAMPAFAHAQGNGKPAAGAAGDAQGDSAAAEAPGTAAPPAGDAKDDSTKAAGSDTPSTNGEGDSAGGICEIDPSQCQAPPEIDPNKEVPKQIYAVQQAYALRVRRFEISPYYSFTLNDQFVSHNAPGLSLNYYISNVLAVGLNGNAYRFGSAANLNRDSDFNAQTRRAARVAVPLTELDWSASANFTYVPMYGKFAGFGDFIFHYDAYVVGGVGVLSDRPIAVIDPDNRTFESKINLAFNAGLGLRIFFNRWFAANLEVRDYIFFDKLENTTIAVDPNQARNPDTWYDDKSRLTNNVQAQIGFSVFLPFSWEYRLPK